MQADAFNLPVFDTLKVRFNFNTFQLDIRCLLYKFKLSIVVEIVVVVLHISRMFNCLLVLVLILSHFLSVIMSQITDLTSITPSTYRSDIPFAYSK